MPIETGCTHCGSDQHSTTDCPMREVIALADPLGLAPLAQQFNEAPAGALRPTVPAPDADQLALDAATDIMALMYGPTPVGGSVRLLAKVQCRVLDAINAATQPAVQDDDTPSEGWPAYHKRKMTTMLDLMRGLRDRYKARLAASPAQSEVQRLREAVGSVVSAGNGLSNIAYNLAQLEGVPLSHYTCELMRMQREQWDKAMAALAASTGQEVKP